ncbi:MAG: isoprenylcysteine carboxylmethyltransferase family protein [Anaerolineaceae bacterium]|jgi:protein-S-isoprenylcysteine O-methyltransferase Ste14|nr:MAG: isoprenylcysteine carboxylmethyltransferase family protein [Anaerolineaceae bacterium]
MTIASVETFIRSLGGATAFSALVILFYGIWRGTRQKAGRVTGGAGRFLRSSSFYFLASVFFFGLSYLGWIRIPWQISPQVRVWMLIIGSLLFFPGMAFLLWARITLGKYYFVSTGLGAQLFADHQLVQAGPYAIVRHPMYVGLAFAAWGALLIYFTWTTIYFVLFAPTLAVRAYREEAALSAEFGEQWQEYCRRVPPFVPRLSK